MYTYICTLLLLVIEIPSQWTFVDPTGLHRLHYNSVPT